MSKRNVILIATLAAAILLAASAFGGKMLGHGHDAKKPAASEFGPGPRASANGLYYAPFLFWDGRKDSLWSQALGPLESPVEHGGNRELYARVIAAHHRAEYEAIFGPLPDLDDRDAVTRVFVNIGKSIAAYERRLQFAPSRFDRYVAGLTEDGRAPDGILTADETAGLQLVVGKANCTQWHNGPLLTNNEFHNTGVPARPAPEPDRGRMAGAQGVLDDEFNCRSRWSDAKPSQCADPQRADAQRRHHESPKQLTSTAAPCAR
jgi:cytochrome c peroxidase